MRFCFLINPTNNWQQAVEHTYQLAKQAQSSHQLTAVFFYGSAAHIAHQDDQQRQWQDLSACPLYICRTMLDKYNLTADSVEPFFQVIGMAPWIMHMEQADRIVEII